MPEAVASPPNQPCPPFSSALLRVGGRADGGSASQRPYEVHIGADQRHRLGELVRQHCPLPEKIVMLVDSHVPESWRDDCIRSLAPLHDHEQPSTLSEVHHFSVPAGDGSKSLEQYGYLAEKILNLGLTRTSALLALGGGMVGDLTGFLAATLLRGVSLVQCPTTLLAAVDSSIGGKTGINALAGKNLIGAFYRPSLVVCDTVMLTSLPPSALRHGYAEIVKIAVIQDTGLFSMLESLPSQAFTDPKQPHFVPMIEKSCALKAAVVDADEYEAGCRVWLNLGHTFAHALESLTHYRLPHGEAVALGLMMAAHLSGRLGVLADSSDLTQRLKRLLDGIGLPTRWPENLGSLPESAAMIDRMRTDKKSRQGAIHFVLPTNIGQSPVVRAISGQEFSNHWPFIKQQLLQ